MIRHLTKILIFTLPFVLFSKWNTEDLCFMSEDLHERLESTKSRDLQQLKAEMANYVEGSWCSKDKASLILDLICITKPQYCVEIGVFRGTSAVVIAEGLKRNQAGKLYAVDAWSNNIATQYFPEGYPGKKWWSKVNFQEAYRSFRNTLLRRKLTKYCEAIRMSSNQFAKYSKEIDFLHLDGDLTEKGALCDVDNFLPKIKNGGCILISNAYNMYKGRQTKGKAIMKIFQNCTFVALTDNYNTLLFQKNGDN